MSKSTAYQIALRINDRLSHEYSYTTNGFITESEIMIYEECLAASMGFTTNWLLRHYFKNTNKYSANGRIHRGLEVQILNKDCKYSQTHISNTLHMANETEIYETTIKEDLSLIIGDQYSHQNYYHFVRNAITSICIGMNLRKMRPGLKFLCHQKFNKKWQHEWLSIVGISAEEIKEIDEKDQADVGKIIRVANLPEKSASKILNELIYTDVYDNSNLNHDKLFITRKSGSVRSLQNEDECYKYLKKYGFRIVDLENYNIKEQVNLFASARIILGLHGSGLIHSYFMQESSKLIELSTSHLNTCFLDSSKCAKIKYGYILSSISNRSRWKPVESTIRIDLSLINAAIDCLLN